MLTVLDDGIEKDHPDLSANYVTMRGRAARAAGTGSFRACCLQGGWELVPSSRPWDFAVGTQPLCG